MHSKKIACCLTVAAMTALAAAAPSQSATPTRVAALTPFTANTLANVGVRPVAIGETLGGSDRFSSKLNGVPRLPLSHPNGPNLERLASYNPQLVLSTLTWRRGQKGMKSLGMKVVESDPSSVNAAIAQTRSIGKTVGRAKQADAQARKMQASIRSATRGIKKHPTVLVVLGVGTSTFAFLDNSWGGDIVKRAGGKLLTRGLRASGGYARISDETVVSRNPDIIIAVPHGEPEDLGKTAAYLKGKPGWRKTKAVKRNRVYVSTGNSLLQAYPDVGRTIKDIRTRFLNN